MSTFEKDTDKNVDHLVCLMHLCPVPLKAWDLMYGRHQML